MQTLLQDLRYGARMLLKNTGFTLVAVVTLALGIGACAVVFSLAQAMTAPPLAARHPDRIAVVSARNLQSGFDYAAGSWPDLQDWRAGSRSVAQFAAMQWPGSLGLAEGGSAEAVRGAYVSANLFTIFEAATVLGRAFTAEEDQPQHAAVVMLGHALWQRRFGGAADVIGRSLKLDGRFYTVVGVLPPEFELAGAQLFLPLAARPGAAATNRAERNLLVFAQLQPGASVAQAQTELAAVARNLAQSYPDTNRDIGVAVRGLREWAAGEYRAVAVLMFSAVGLVLLIVCANVAGLLLARGVERRKEYAVRAALGATRWQLIRQVLTESALLAGAGGVLGFLLALWVVDALNAANPFGWRFPLRTNEAALGFTLMVSALTVLLCGLFPALLAARADVQEFLKEGASRSRQSSRLRKGLITGQIALSFLLLAGAGLLLRSAWSFSQLPLGFDPRGVVTMWLNVAEHRYPLPQAAAEFGQQVLRRFQQLPAVRHAALANWVELPADGDELGFTAQGAPSLSGQDAPMTLCTAVTGDYFNALGATLLRGRTFNEADREGAAGVAIINDRLARALAPDGDAVGRQLKLGGRDANRPWLTVVGVIADVRHPSRLELSEVPFDIYLPFAQQPTALGWTAANTSSDTQTNAASSASRLRSLSFLVRAADPSPLKAALQREVWAVDREQPIQQVRLLTEGVRIEAFEKRAMAWVLGAFALTALALSAMGLYGLLAYFVTERQHEIGIRLALGADSRDVVRLIIRQGMTLAALGIGLGLCGALALAQLLQGLLYGVSATDPLTLCAAVGALGAVALAACWWPARRAAEVNPLIALRAE